MPSDDSEPVDLQLAAIVIMAHLDRLATPYLPPPTFLEVFSLFLITFKLKYFNQYKLRLHVNFQNTKLFQEVRTWGWVPWSLEACDQLGEIGVAKMSCSEKSVLILTVNHQVYLLSNNNEVMVRFIILHINI